MKKIIFLFLFTLIHVSVFSQGKVVFETMSVDLGDVNTDIKPIRQEFRFVNEGNQPIKILKVLSSNRNFEVYYPQEEIKPGESGILRVEGTIGPGKFKKTITVNTTGYIEYSRLYIGGNNLGQGLQPPILISGSVSEWIDNNKKLIRDLPDCFVYEIGVQYKVGSDLKIKDVTYEKKGLPQSIINDIERLIREMPKFEAGHSIAGDFTVTYSTGITNSGDKPTFKLLASPIVSEAINKIKYQYKDKINSGTYLISYIIERDRTISNIRLTATRSLYSDEQKLSLVKQYILSLKEELKDKRDGKLTAKDRISSNDMVKF